MKGFRPGDVVVRSEQKDHSAERRKHWRGEAGVYTVKR